MNKLRAAAGGKKLTFAEVAFQVIEKKHLESVGKTKHIFEELHARETAQPVKISSAKWRAYASKKAEERAKAENIVGKVADRLSKFDPNFGQKKSTRNFGKIASNLKDEEGVIEGPGTRGGVPRIPSATESEEAATHPASGSATATQAATVSGDAVGSVVAEGDVAERGATASASDDAVRAVVSEGGVVDGSATASVSGGAGTAVGVEGIAPGAETLGVEAQAAVPSVAAAVAEGTLRSGSVSVAETGAVAADGEQVPGALATATGAGASLQGLGDGVHLAEGGAAAASQDGAEGGSEESAVRTGQGKAGETTEDGLGGEGTVGTDGMTGAGAADSGAGEGGSAEATTAGGVPLEQAAASAPEDGTVASESEYELSGDPRVEKAIDEYMAKITFRINIDLGHGKQDNMLLEPGQNPTDVADAFCKKHSLTDSRDINGMHRLLRNEIRRRRKRLRKFIEENLKDDVNCAHCLKPVEGDVVSITLPERDSVYVHEACREGFLSSQLECCYHCNKPLTGDCIRFDGEDTSFFLHAECKAPYFRAMAEPCSHCSEPLEGGYQKVQWTQGGENTCAMVHSECREAFLTKQDYLCMHCGKTLVGKVVRGNFQGKPLHVHEECKESFLLSCLPKCTSCGKPIKEGGVKFQVGEDEAVPLHSECVDSYKASKAESCAHCNKPLLGKYSKLRRAGSQESIPLHAECVDLFKAAQLDAASMGSG
eukprot:Rmarinus@m.27130